MIVLRWAAMGILLGATFSVSRLYSKEVDSNSEREEAYRNIAMFTRAMEQIRNSYVDKDKVSYELLIRGAMRGMMNALDEHSQFMDKEMYDDMQDDTRGQFGGLGIIISVKDNQLTIVSPIEDTPGFRAGLLPEDRILEINGYVCDGISLPEAVKRLRGEPGSKVTLKILRPQTRDVQEITLERAEIKVPSVKDTRIIEDGIGYIRVTAFNETTVNNLRKELENLQREGMKALILDLRNNPGGLLRSAIDVSQMFLSNREVVVSTQGRRSGDEQVFRVTSREKPVSVPMVVMVNSGSASASEIVAGALQDHKRAVLVGEKTFGKGSVQSVLPMEEGTALRLTTARYFTPANRMIHDKGIEPDILVPMSPDDWQALMTERNRQLSLPAHEADFSAIKNKDIQLTRALSTLKGIMIYQARNTR